MSSQQATPNPRVGIAAMIVDAQDKILIGKRKGSHGAGTLQLPGGHLEFAEDVMDCAARETLEETGLHVKPTKIFAVTNDVFDVEMKHYITLFVHCEMVDPSAIPEIKEPEKCDGWEWADWAQLQAIKEGTEIGQVLFRPLHNLLDQKSDFADLGLKL